MYASSEALGNKRMIIFKQAKSYALLFMNANDKR